MMIKHKSIPIDELIKSSAGLKETDRKRTSEKGLNKDAGKRHYRHPAVNVAVLILIVIAVHAGIIYGTDAIARALNGGSDGICEMFIYEGNMYYTDYKSTLYQYDNLSGKGRVVSRIENANGGQVFQDEGYIYYSSGSAIYRKSLKDNTSRKVVTGKNVWVDAVSGGRLFYHIAYKDSKDEGFSEFEQRIYELDTGKDTVLFDKSKNMWHMLSVDGDTVIADANIQDYYGIYSMDLVSGMQKRLSGLRGVEGILFNRKFYFTTYDEKGLRVIDIDEGRLEEIKLPGMGEDGFFVDRITGFEDDLYAAAYYDDENHIIKLDLITHDTDILGSVRERVWRLVTDGKNLYSYGTISPADKKGNITVIPLK